MKSMYIVATLVAVILLSELTSAQIIPPFLGGFGFPFLGGFGFPFLGGFGGLGLGLGLGGFGRLGLLRGKRDNNSTITETVRCIVSTKSDVVVCSTGVGERLACEIQRNLNLNLKLNLTHLAITQRLRPKNGEIFSFISTRSFYHRVHHGQGLVGFLSNEKMSNGKYTFIDPTTLQPVLLSLYFDVTLGQPGFIVKDKVCYNAISEFIQSNEEKIRFDLIIA